MVVLVSILMALGLITPGSVVSHYAAQGIYQQNQQAVNDYASQNSIPIDWDNELEK